MIGETRWLSVRQARVPSPDANTSAYWFKATDAQAGTLEAAWCEDNDVDESDDDEPLAAGYAENHKRDQNDIVEASARVAAKDAALKTRTDRDVDEATQSMVSGMLTQKRKEKSRALSRQAQKVSGGTTAQVPRWDEGENDELFQSGGFRAYHGGSGSGFGSGSGSGPGASTGWRGGHEHTRLGHLDVRPTTPGGRGEGFGHSPAPPGSHFKITRASSPLGGGRRSVNRITPYPVTAVSKELRDKQEMKDAAWARRINQSICDLRGQNFSVETSPWLARFLLDERRMNQIKHVVLNGSFIEPSFCLDLCRILAHTHGVVSLEMINCGMKIQALAPLCMLIQRGNEGVAHEDESGEARRKLLNAKNLEESKKHEQGVSKHKHQRHNLRGRRDARAAFERGGSIMSSAKNLHLSLPDRPGDGALPKKAGSRRCGIGLNEDVADVSQLERRKAEAVALRETIMKQFNFSANGLQSIKIGGNRIGDRGMITLAGVLANDGVIRILDVSSTGFGESGAVAVGGMLENTSSLEWLSMEWNLIGSGKGAKAIGAGLASSFTLKCLDVSSCSLGDKGGSYIASALADNELLEELDLGSNRLSRDTAEVLADALRKNGTLKSLTLENNPLGYEGAGQIVKAMMVNTVLDVLNLQKCSFMKDDKASHGVSFDENKPAGNYRLNLSLPGHYIVATKLVELWEHQGEKTWRNVTLDGKKFVLKEDHHWPKRMPQKGHLVLDFVPNEHRGKNSMLPISHEDFDELWCQILHPGVPIDQIGRGADNVEASDEWILSYAAVLTQGLYFRAEQVAQMIQTLSWSDNRVKLMTMIFGRIVDLDNIVQIERVLKPSEWSRALNMLGMQNSYHPQNLTGSYSLNLARSVDYMIAMRLRDSYLKQSEMEQDQGVVVTPSEENPCWRNVILNFKPLEGPAEFGIGPKHLAELDIPTEGVLSLDFVSFSTPAKEAKPISVGGFNYLLDVLKQPLKGNDSRMTLQVARDLRMGTTSYLDTNFQNWKERRASGGTESFASMVLAHNKSVRRKMTLVTEEDGGVDVVDGVEVAAAESAPLLRTRVSTFAHPTENEHPGPEIEPIPRAALEQVVREECDGKDLEEVATEVVVRLQGEIFNARDVADSCYYILEGTAKAYVSRKIDDVYEDIPVTKYGRGHFMNDEAVCRDREHSIVTARAAGDDALKLLRIPKDIMLSILSSPGDTAKAIAHNAEKREFFFVEEAYEHANKVIAEVKLPDEYDPMAPQPISFERLAAALKKQGFDPETMEKTVAPGDFITEVGKPAEAAYYIVHGSVASTSVWAERARKSAEHLVGKDDGGTLSSSRSPTRSPAASAAARSGAVSALSDDTSAAGVGDEFAKTAAAADADERGSVAVNPGLIVGMIPLALNLKVGKP